MSTLTANLSLSKNEITDVAKTNVLTDQPSNMDIIDANIVIPRMLGGGLLINGNFDIDQREGSPYTLAEYTLDRWKKIGANGQIEQSLETPDSKSKYSAKLSLVSGGPLTVSFAQHIENPNNVLYNEKSTLSLMCKGSVNKTMNVRLRNITQGLTLQGSTYDVTTDWQKVVINFNASTDWVKDDVIEISLSNVTSFNDGEVVYFSQVKFELGEVATEFIPNNPSDEKFDSYRYVWIPNDDVLVPSTLVGVNLIRFYLSLPNDMRIDPTILGAADVDIVVLNKTTGVIITGFSFIAEVRNNTLRINATKTAHGLADCILKISSNSGFDAEL